LYPLTARLIDEIWYINGNIQDENRIGGEPHIKIKKSNGEILGILHTR